MQMYAVMLQVDDAIAVAVVDVDARDELVKLLEARVGDTDDVTIRVEAIMTPSELLDVADYASDNIENDFD